MRRNPDVQSPCASGCHHPAAAAPDVAGPSSEGADPSGPNGPYSRATLVICPLVAVIQWRQEIARYVAPNALKVSYANTQWYLNLDTMLDDGTSEVSQMCVAAVAMHMFAVDVLVQISRAHISVCPSMLSEVSGCEIESRCKVVPHALPEMC